jgi:hypothetical protein
MKTAQKNPKRDRLRKPPPEAVAPIGIAHEIAGVEFSGGPGRREAAQ